MFKQILIAALAGLFVATGGSTGALAQERTITVASTTSTEQSGLFGFLLPKFTAATGIGVKVVAVGTGQALDIGRRGDADVVFVHDKVAEEKFIAEGFGVKRLGVMYNDFVVIGPKADPAKIAGSKDVSDALRKIAAAKAPFISRGDRSGTHAAELRLWKDAGVDLDAGQGRLVPRDRAGHGPGAQHGVVLRCLCAVRPRHLAHFQEPRRSCHPHRRRPAAVQPVWRDAGQSGQAFLVKAKDGQAFVDWLVSADGQKTIGDYKIGGERLFFPNASD